MTNKEVNYSVNIGDHLNSRVDRHVNLLKKLSDRCCSKQMWILEALREKLEREKENHFYEISKEKHVHIKVQHQINEEIEKKIDIMKKLRKSYSKKQLIVEAISEKLEREDRIARDLLEKAKLS